MQVPRPCRLCSCQKFLPRFEKNNYNIDKCIKCGLTQVTNPPSCPEIESCYDRDYFATYYGQLQNNARFQQYEYSKFSYRLNEIEKKSAKKGTILDVGCSFGYFLSAAKERGWEAYGVEVSHFAAQFARDHFGLTVLDEPIGRAKLQPEFFDVVTFWNVVEHLEDPLAAMQEVQRILKPNGIVVLTTGNVESFLARAQKGNWRMLIPPIHLSHFSPATITRLLASCQLQLIELTSALPYEALLQRLRLITFAKWTNVSDKMLVYAKRVTSAQTSDGL